MASWAEEAAKLTDAQRWQVLFLYREFREGDTKGPLDALWKLLHDLQAQCTFAVLAGAHEEAAVRARQSCYAAEFIDRIRCGVHPAERWLFLLSVELETWTGDDGITPASS